METLSHLPWVTIRSIPAKARKLLGDWLSHLGPVSLLLLV